MHIAQHVCITPTQAREKHKNRDACDAGCTWPVHDDAFRLTDGQSKMHEAGRMQNAAPCKPLTRPAVQVTPLHWDSMDNFLCQVAGVMSASQSLACCPHRH